MLTQCSLLMYGLVTSLTWCSKYHGVSCIQSALTQICVGGCSYSSQGVQVRRQLCAVDAPVRLF